MQFVHIKHFFINLLASTALACIFFGVAAFAHAEGEEISDVVVIDDAVSVDMAPPAEIPDAVATDTPSDTPIETESVATDTQLVEEGVIISEPTVTEESSEVVAEETLLSTDKDDYHPGETASIFGRFFSSLQSYVVKIFGSDENQEHYSETEETVVADTDGSFSLSYVLDSLYRPFYEVVVSTLEGEKVAETWFRDSAIPIYDQCSNDDGDGYATGDTGCRWINGAINAQNSTYYEGDSTIHRTWLTGFAPGSTHTVTYKYGTTKGGHHAYDYLTTWSASEGWSTLADRCDGITGCTTAGEVTAAMQDDPSVPNTIEPSGGSRLFTLRGGSISSVSVPAIVSGTYAGDSETVVTVTFTTAGTGTPMCSSSNGPGGTTVVSCGVALWFGAHIAETAKWTAYNGTTGAGSIQGSPYHVALASVDNVDATQGGGRDNQMSADVIVVPQKATLTLLKTVVNDNGGTALDTAWTLAANGSTSISGTEGSSAVTAASVDPGIYALSESGGPSGYAASQYSCVKNGGAPVIANTITLVANDVAVCTITNNDIAPTLTVVKQVEPANDTGKFNLQIDGQTVGTGTNVGDEGTTGAVAVSAGAHTVGETAGTATTLSDYIAVITGDCAANGSVSLAVGENKICTITNTKKGHIIVDKVTVPSGATTTFSFTTDAGSNFSLTDAATPHDSGAVVPGTYSVSESVPAGWDQTSATCSDGSNPSSISLQAGETVTCTFTNTKRGHIIIQKDAVPDTNTQAFTFTNNFGNGNPASFNLTDTTAAGLPSYSAEVLPGKYAVSEDPVAGWQLDATTCDQGETVGDIDVAAGETVTCKFTNQKLAKITLVKTTVGDNGTFDFVMTGTGLPSTAQLTTSGNTASQVFSDLDPDNTYSITETPIPAGWDKTSATCNNGDPVTAITPNAGEEITCTFTNTKRGKIIIEKQTLPDSDAQPFVFAASYDQDGFSLSDGQQNDSGFIVPGNYSVSETIPAGWDQTSAECSDGSTLDSINLAAGEIVTCVVTNTKRGHIIVDKVTDPSGDAGEFEFTSNYGENFTLTDTDTPNDSGALVPGSYSVSEIVPTGWEQTSAVCDDDDSTDPDALTLDPGETIHCTFTNEKDAHIIVVKQTIPAGDKTVFDFDLSYGDGDTDLADGQQDDSGDLDPGTYSISENVPEGWALTDLSCLSSNGGAVATSSDLTLAAGETITCTFVNTKLGKIIVEKQTLPVGSQESFEFSGSFAENAFSLKDGEQYDSGYLLPDTYQLSEVAETGWDLEAYSCDDGSNLPQIDLAPGEVVTCTFENTQRGKVTIAKETLGGDGEFEFTGSINLSSTLSDGESETLEDVLSGSYILSESALEGWALTSIVCDDENSVVDLEDEGVTINVEPGEHVTCTFTNTKLGKIITEKQTLPDGDQTSFDFTASWDNGTDPDFALTDDGKHDSGYLMPGTYALSEVVPEGWIQSSLLCESSLEDAEAAASLELDAGEIITCVFENTKIQDLVVEKNVHTSYTRTYDWTIDKSVTPASWNLFTGESGTSEYTIALTKDDGTDSAHAATGTITITNPNTNPTLDATITNVSDVLDVSGAASVDCGVTYPYTLEENSQLVCTYTKTDASPEDVLNTATVDTTGLVPGGQGTAVVTYGAPTLLVNDTVSIDDTFADGDKESVMDDMTYTYTRIFSCDADEGTIDNTATIVETNQSDSASVEVDCYEITVTKDARTSYDKTYAWTIDKTGDRAALTLSPGQIFAVNYDVTVDADAGTEGNFAAEGTITVHNPAPMTATINSVSDVIANVGAANVDCEATFPFELAAGEDLVCTYDAAMPNKTTQVNTATAVRQNHEYDEEGKVTDGEATSVDGTAQIDFTSATVTEIDECVTVDDTFGDVGAPDGTVLCQNETPKTYEYSHDVGPYEQAACGTTIDVDNTASFDANDTDATGSDTWGVDVNVACVCSLTQGYWKTHNDSFKGGAPSDDNWASLGVFKELTGFFTTSNSAPIPGPNSPTHTWFKVFWTAPKGNAYYNLAHQYEAAKLNVLNGANPPAQVVGALTFAENFFKTYTPTNWPKNQKNALTTNAGILGAFNEGTTNPAGHCTEIPQ